MTKKLEIYTCDVCKNTVEVLFEGFGELVCCGQNMKRTSEQNIADESLGEKHVPIVTRTEDGIEIKVGSTPHPMEDNHYIQFIEAHSRDGRYVKQKYLYPNEEPVLRVKCGCDEEVIAREICNVHGLWTSKVALENN